MNFSFKRLSLFLAIIVVCVSTAMASTTCPTQPSSPVGATYANYNPGAVDNGTGSITCATENLQFSLFGFSASAGGGAVALTPGAIGVTVVDEPAGTEPGSGFDFTPTMTAGPNQTLDGKISFLVTALNGTKIDDVFIAFNGSVTGNGSTHYSEQYCTVSFVSGCSNFAVSNPPPDFSNGPITIPPVTQLWITKDFSISGGTNGSASISGVDNNFSSPVPEPREIGLLAFAMIGLVFAHRRFKASSVN